jgi:hypothetical protein
MVPGPEPPVARFLYFAVLDDGIDDDTLPQFFDLGVGQIGVFGSDDLRNHHLIDDFRSDIAR